MKRQEIIAFYVDNDYDFVLTQNETRMPAFRLQILLAKAGVLKIQDKINYGTKAQKLGGLAEQRFHELVPKAIDANKLFKKNYPGYDFVVGNLTIDVKFSSIYSRKNTEYEYWGVKTSGCQDCLVVFLERNAGDEMNDPYILFIPMSFIDEGQRNIHISRNGVWLKEFAVYPDELARIIDDYAELKGSGDIA
ncbi:hypothetical protein [Enterococcus sp. 5B3_DIV0040]|uniref:hypothetical protein n=1 Tax=Enterococcus sp. 5B3_DIV0040 TaxID=1834182 RepID=UPI000A355BFA|nr:hypothetical protein [Enterococcus sp. 5B3_DIV0040]OTO02217.1 hypothetical protein A5883_003044 [Enterococcus sp. 5B3_DIV0040]